MADGGLLKVEKILYLKNRLADFADILYDNTY